MCVEHLQNQSPAPLLLASSVLGDMFGCVGNPAQFVPEAEVRAMAKERQKKDNHNLSTLLLGFDLIGTLLPIKPLTFAPSPVVLCS